MTVYGYARVSTDSQNLDRQLDALMKYGIDKLYCEKMSGTKKSRTELDSLLNEIKDIVTPGVSPSAGEPSSVSCSCSLSFTRLYI